MARMMMFASRTIISAGSGFVAATKLLEVGDKLRFVHVGQGLGEAVGGGFQFRKIGGPGVFAARGT